MRKKQQQFNLFTVKSHPNLSGTRLEHGGETRKGCRKIARPVDPKRSMHIVLRSSRARGELSLLNLTNRKIVEKVLLAAQKRFAVKVYNKANVGNHLHLIIKARTRRDFQAFMRMISGRIAALVTGAKKGHSFKPDATAGTRKFWDALAFSRVINWGRDFIDTQIYITKNLFEGEGIDLMTPLGVQKFTKRSGRYSVSS